MSESTDVTALFRCRYCKKCVEGVQKFFRHKRAHHTGEFEANPEETNQSPQSVEIPSEADGRRQSEKLPLAVATPDRLGNLCNNNDSSEAELPKRNMDFGSSFRRDSTDFPEFLKQETPDKILYEHLNLPAKTQTSRLPHSQILPEEEDGDDEIQVIGVFPPLPQHPPRNSYPRDLVRGPVLHYNMENAISPWPSFSQSKSISEILAENGYFPQQEDEEDLFPKIVHVRSLAQTNSKDSLSSYRFTVPFSDSPPGNPVSRHKSCTVTKLEFKEFHEVIAKAFPPGNTPHSAPPGGQTDLSRTPNPCENRDFPHTSSPRPPRNSYENESYSANLNLHHPPHPMRPLSKSNLSSSPPFSQQASQVFSPPPQHPQQLPMPNNQSRQRTESDESVGVATSGGGDAPELVEAGDGSYFCPTCYKPLRSLSTLTNHMRLHTGEKPFKCSQCDLKFSQRFTRKRHEINVHGKPLYSCPQCPKKFFCLTERSLHRAQCHGREVYKCKYCGAVFQGLDNLKFHESLHIQEVRAFKNEPPKISTYSSSPKHQEQSHGTSELNVKISSFSTDKQFRSNSIPFPISRSRKQAGKLHRREKRFQCNFCHKSFSRSTTCNYHQNLHTGARPYKCELCNKSFSHPASRVQHEAYSHSEFYSVSRKTLMTTQG